MSNLLNKLNQDLVEAQKAQDELRVSTLRFLLSAVKNAQIAKGKELTDDEVTVQIQKDAKKHKESIDAFEKANRKELAQKETKELAVLNAYLPKQMNKDEIKKIVEEVISQTGASSMSDLGGVMGQVMAKVGGQADGAMVSQIVREKLLS